VGVVKPVIIVLL